MYNLWLEIKGIKFIAFIVSILLLVLTFLIEKKIDIYFLLFALLFLIVIIKSFLKYLSLKKNGTLLESVPYYFKMLNNSEKVLIIDYIIDDGTTVHLYKKKLNWKDANDSGTTKLIINQKNPKQYYIFDPN